ncbi:MAG: lysophospholipid acyltransferase family protein [Bacteroidales bacterium]|nr:lysophospholipid acyltransferase family protein [Bacteroidales bacterium]
MIIPRVIVRSLMRLLALLPLRVHYAFARVVSWLAEKVFRYRLADVMVNLGRSFPEKDYSELKSICHRFYRHFGNLVAEAVWFGGSSARRLHRQRIVEFDGLDELTRLYESSPSVMVLMSHSGNWELYGGFASFNYTGKPMIFDNSNVCIVYLQQSSKMWDEIMRRNRLAPMTEPFEGYLESRRILRYAIEHRNEKKVYNFITDQYPYFSKKDPLHVRFMNQDTVTMTGAADLARKLGMAVCFLSTPEVERGKYIFRYIPICSNASESTSEEIMSKYYALLEEDIRKQPWNYLWTHRRWKIVNQ